MGLRKVLVSLCVGVGAVGLGAAASAAVDGFADGSTTSTTDEVDGVADESTTTTPGDTEPPSTEAPTTVPPTTEAPIAEAPAPDAPTTVPPVTELPPAEPPTADSELPSNLYGQCNAFAGREQPGKSRAWERLHELAGGDIDALCAEVLAAPRPDDGDEASEDAAKPRREAKDAPGRSGRSRD